jgi:hypothetical protein
MIRTCCTAVVLTAVLCNAGLSLAQEPYSIPPAVTESADPASAIQVVAGFLNLRPDQAQALALLLHIRHETQAPLVQGIAERERRIHGLLESSGDPSEIGGLVIEVHRLRQGATHAQAEFLARFGELLDQQQRPRWSAVRTAEGLMPILPAFRTLRLL